MRHKYTKNKDITFPSPPTLGKNMRKNGEAQAEQVSRLCVLELCDLDETWREKKKRNTHTVLGVGLSR